MRYVNSPPPLDELRKAPDHEVREVVARQVVVEDHEPAHTVRIHDVLFKPHQFASHVHLVRALDPGDVFADGVIAAVERALPACVGGESASDREIALRRLARGLRDVHPDIGPAEERCRNSPTCLAVPPEPGVEQQRRPGGERMVHGHVPNVDRVAVAVGRQKVCCELARVLLEPRIEIPAADLLLPEVVIHLGHVLVVVLPLSGAHIRQLPSRAVRQRYVLEQLLRDRAEARGGDPVVRERRAGDRVDELPVRQQAGKVAGAFGRRRHEADLAFRGADDPRALVRSEEKQLVLDDGTSHRTAELVAVEGVVPGSEEIPRIQRTVPQKFEDVAVNVVGAGARHDIHHAAGRVAKLRRKVVRVERELLNRVRVGERQIHVQVRVVVPRAVKLVIDL